MKITTSIIPDFISNLKSAGVFNNVVYYETSKHQLNGKTKRDATCFDVVFQASAILEFKDGQALLVCGVDCGVDRHTSDGALDGSAESHRLLTVLKEYCDSRGLVLMPGMLDQ